MAVPKPKPCYLDQLVHYRLIDGRSTFRSPDGRRLYQWDSLHGEIEVYDKNGYHLGALDSVSGLMLAHKKAVKGRRLFL